ncbi:MTH1187 family thiamine-binding protein [Heliobacterium gestii]|uniref:MTH1187 family thiamine-binding protein n=1 Tax=Heliomicrobium gestii TaxID=2699 RepID=A0A845L9N7_HELGE|nr:MTH1187 family thiamine-binding protein [Heliomicrobium gestii]MBM7865380.1 uncharacterized protein (TIGR00106 family) [Heliomicrobium gestii]MZP41640.1 MTH1187 family thiamine-binding protein [Heliomicrobium gestii]
MPVIAEVTIIPLGTGSPSLSRYVADCHKALQEAEGIRYQLTPMSTVIEGELDLVVDVIRKMHEVPFAAGALRVSTTIRIDDRRDKPLSMEGKVRSVEQKLAE